MNAKRQLPPPWQVVEHPESFEVRAATGQNLAFVYFEERPDRRMQLKRLTRDEARRIAVNVARLPELLAKPAPPADRRVLAASIETNCKVSAASARSAGFDALAYLLETAAFEASQHTR